MSMTVRSFQRGHRIEFVNNNWIYSDTKESVSKERACIRCGKVPTKEGHDACLGTIEGITSACCGHGVEEGYSL